MQGAAYSLIQGAHRNVQGWLASSRGGVCTHTRRGSLHLVSGTRDAQCPATLGQCVTPHSKPTVKHYALDLVKRQTSLEEVDTTSSWFTVKNYYISVFPAFTLKKTLKFTKYVLA